MQAYSETENASIRPDVTAGLLNNLWEELLSKNGVCWARVVSDSMSPTLRRGDNVLVEKACPDNIRFGDIIVFKSDGSLTTHRVIGKCKLGGERHWLEKGDANLTCTLVPVKNIIGIVTAISNTEKARSTISGGGRFLQLTLTCVSYTSYKLWVLLRYCLTRGGRSAHRYYYGAAYRRFFYSVYKITLRLIM
jgi:signal peptidase I